MAQWVKLLDHLTTHTSLSPIRRRIAPSFVNYKKMVTRLAAISDKVYQLLAHGRWLSPGTPDSSITKTGRHDIAEILLKKTLNTINQNKNTHIKLPVFFAEKNKVQSNNLNVWKNIISARQYWITSLVSKGEELW